MRLRTNEATSVLVALLSTLLFAPLTQAQLIEGETCFQQTGDLSCISLSIDSATTGETQAISSLAEFDGSPLDFGLVLGEVFEVPLEWTGDEFMQVSAQFVSSREFLLTIKGATSIQPTTTSPDNLVSEILAQANFKGKLVVEGPTSAVQMSTEVKIEGNIGRPSNPLVGSIQSSNVVSLKYELNGNPAQSFLHSSTVAFDESDAFRSPTFSGFSSDSFVFEVPLEGSADRVFYSSLHSAFSSLSLPVGSPIEVNHRALSVLFMWAYNSGGSQKWESDFKDTFSLRLTVPEGYSFVMVPEPSTTFIGMTGMLALGFRRRRA